MRYLCCCLFVCVVAWTAEAQIPDSIAERRALEQQQLQRQQALDSTQVDLNLPELKEPRVYEPKKALLWSVVPAGGQIYNRRWWKVPLVFSAFAGMVAAVDYNSSNYSRFQDAYDKQLAGETHEFTGTRLEDANQLRVLRNSFDRNRQLSYVGLFAVFALQGVEAFVDTHLRNFDIDDDLSQRIEFRPRFMVPSPGAMPLPVLTMQWTF